MAEKINTHQLKKDSPLDFYKQAYENSPVLLRTIDKNGIIIECNKLYCHTLGLEKDEIIGRSIFEHIADKSMKLLSDTFLKWKKTGKVGEVKLWLKRNNGTIFPVILTATNILDTNGNFVGSNSVIREISELYEAEEKVHKRDKLIKKQYSKLLKLTQQKDSFLAMVAHELKTPLVPIRSYTDLLLSNSFGELTEKQKDTVTRIQNSGKSLEFLISDLLDTQKLELDKFRLNQELNLLDEIIDSSVDEFAPDIKNKHIKIVKSLKSDVKCFCDYSRIKQIINNLLSNAIDFSPSNGGKIEISLKQRAKNAHVIVKDNGIGIKKSSLSKIFSKFYQIDSSINREHGGTGLGLTISSGIAEAHGGKMYAKSKGTGHGAEIHLILPLNLDKKLQN